MQTGGNSMNRIVELLTNRRSIRNYRTDQVDEGKIDEILQAGLYAPTGMNRQDVVFVAVTDKETRDRLSAINAEIMGTDKDPFYGAPAVIVVLADRTSPTHVYDGALAMGNMMNAAYSLGLGSCWIHRAKETFETEEGRALLKKWGINSDVEGIGNCILGYTDDLEPKAAERKAGRIIKIS
jgi:nitroreductase